MKRINYIVALIFAATLTLFAQETQPEATDNSLQDVLNRYGNSEIIEKAKAGVNNLPTAECETPEQEEIVTDHYFTVSADGLKVKFSKGNLRYNIGTDTWSFAPKQYDYVGMSNINLGNPDYKGDIDLFGWSADGKFGVNPSNADADYAGSFVDWGLNMGNHWRTLTSDEWNYLIRTRRVNGQQAYTIASVNGMIGLVVLPDDWQLPAGITLELAYYPDTRVLESNVFTIAQWNQLEQAGAVFLPAVGTRVGGYGNTMNGDVQAATVNPETGFYSWVSNVSEYGYYWSATPHATTAKSAYQMIWSPYYFNDRPAFPAMWSTEKRRGNAVRLVYDETYESQVKWTVRWVDYADKEVYSTTIDDPEESAEFAGTDPQCYTDAQFDYTFAGWSEAVAAEELHTITYKAKYDRTECVYTVVFVWNPDLCKNKRSGYGNELLYSNADNVESYTFKYGEQASLANTVGTEPKTIETDQALATCTFAFDGLTFGDNMKDLIKCGTSDNRYYYVYADITYQVKVKFNIGSTSQTTLNSCGEMPIMPTYTDASGAEKKFGIYQDLVNPIYVDGKLFKGWTPAITDVPCYPFETENPVVEYAAKLVDVYTIKFVGADGRELESHSQVDVSVDGFAGVKLYNGSDPTQSATDAQTFSFTGWSENIDTENLTYTYTAQFNATARKYTITFNNRCTVSGATSANTTTSEYDAKQIEYGQTITAPTANPTCEGYQFDGWLLDGTENTYLSADDKVTGAATYIATYKPLFTFCFYDEDGLNQLCCTEKQYLANTNPTDVYCLESIPSKPSTAQDTYSFSGWEKIAEDELTHTISYKAVFSSITNTYTITFKDQDGTPLSSKTVAYGGTIVAPDVNTPEGYDFAGWKVEGSDDVLTSLPTVSGNVTYVPAFTPIVYTVYYLGEGVTDLTQAICSTTVTYQEKANPVSCITDDNKPVKPSTAQYDYVLSWSRPIEDAEKRTIVYNAVFTPQTRKYTVVFADRTCVEADPTGAPTEAEQTVIFESELEYGASITVPAENPTCENHIFLGWKQLRDEETDEIAEDFYTGGATVSGNVTYLAQYTDRVTVRFYADQWSNVKAYEWKWIDGQADPAKPLGDWGKQEPLPINEEGWYSVSCPISYSILFYIELEDGSISQTVDIGPITKDTCFELGSQNGMKYEVDNLYQCTHSVYKVLGSENIFDIHISDYDQIGYNYNLDGIPVDDMPNMKRNVREDGNVEYTYMLNNVHLSSSDRNWFAVLKTRYEMNDDTETLEWKCIGVYPSKAYINGPTMAINVSISGTYNINFSYVVNSTTPSYTLELLEADADVYVVAGDMFDDKWNPTATDNQMTLQDDGTYALSKQLVLESDTYEYKIVKNGSKWFPESNEYGDNNMEMPIEYEGTYNVTFRFNPEAQAISADTAVVSYKVAFKIGDAVLDGCVQTMTPDEIETFCAATDAPCESSVTDYTDADNAYIFIGWEQDYTITRGNLTLKPKYKTVPLGAFSVGTDEEGNARYVWFSKGNLQYQATTGTWRFAENQYDFVGNSSAGTVYDETGMKSNNQNAAADYTGWIDLFALGANGYNDRMPYAYTTTNEITADLTNDEYDWGRNEISGYAAGTWRTLSQTEWEYLLNTRDNAAAKCGKAQIKLNSNTTVKCVVFLPDYYNAENITFKSGKTQGFTDNQYDLQSETGMANFNALLQENALIMPVAGMRNGRNLVMTNGNYWTSSVNSTGAMGIAGTFGSSLTIATNDVSLSAMPQSTGYGYSVRLASDSKPAEPSEPTGGGEEETDKWFVAGGEELFGRENAWNADALEMTFDESSNQYVGIIESIELSAGVYQYKVTNGTWTVSFPVGAGENAVLNIPADGTYQITFYYIVGDAEPTAVAHRLLACVSADGNCGADGDNVKWQLSCDGELLIYGNGAMANYSSNFELPWYEKINNIKSVIIEDGVTSIGDYAFYFSDYLVSIEIPNSVTSIGSYAFKFCDSMTSIDIPNNVTSIGEQAFMGCSSLTSINIPNGVTSIGASTFFGCSSLRSIDIPNSVTSIGETAFYGCSNITSAIIGNGVTSIGDWAFNGCFYMNSVTLGNNVVSIGAQAFYKCRNLTSITCEALLPPTMGEKVWYNVSTSIPVYVPAESVEAYKSADGWSQFTNIQAIQ